jgi:hypothetical protein
MTQEQFDKLVKEVGEKAASDIKTRTDAFEKSLNEKYEAMMKGTLTVDEFKKFKDFKAVELNIIEGIHQSQIGDLTKTVKAQGDEINRHEARQGQPTVRKSMEEWFEERNAIISRELRKKQNQVKYHSAHLICVKLVL